jgi:hypothetical protein
LERGDFYASTGVTLRDYSASRSEIKIDIVEDIQSQSKYAVQFIGRWGLRPRESHRIERQGCVDAAGVFEGLTVPRA